MTSYSNNTATHDTATHDTATHDTTQTQHRDTQDRDTQHTATHNTAPPPNSRADVICLPFKRQGWNARRYMTLEIHIPISHGEASNVGLKTNIPATRLLRTTEQFYCRECRRIEACTRWTKRKGKQTAITASFTSYGTVSGPPLPSSSSTSRKLPYLMNAFTSYPDI